jgi:DMSO/TMAO reductase YedYZ molybdopterin-dependent catalytic subunit
MTESRKFITSAPENSETPLDAIRGWVTPTRLFFVRNHFDVPPIDVHAWRLEVAGCVERPRYWTWQELAELPERTVLATVECAGNGRSFLQPVAAGVQWGAGAIGHAEWTGVPLREVLLASGVDRGTIEILFEGADCGSEPDHPEPMHFARSLPLAKAMHPDTLLATRMNGEPLEAAHGYPLRLFVPGWYGVASVKWLRRIAAVREPFGGYFQSTKYTVRRQIGAEKQSVVVGPMAVKSEIIRPRVGETLPTGRNRIAGVAWAGEEPVERVEVSTDGGRRWNLAALVGPRAAYSWTLWEYLWHSAEPGEYQLLARATSASGQSQPERHDPLLGGYMIHNSRPQPVRVAATTAPFAERMPADALLYDMNAYTEENFRRPLDVELEYEVGAGI